MKRILICAEYTLLESLVLYHLSAIAKEENWNVKLILAKSPLYKELQDAVLEYNPDIVGFTIYTGNHKNVADILNRIKKNNKDIKIVIGGAHPTYFPKDCLKFSDYVIVGEGFDAFRRILKGTANKGIVVSKVKERFPIADRKDFYDDNITFKENPIKNIIASTGCPYNCSYCYNSNLVESTKGLTDSHIEQVKIAQGGSVNRFYPLSQRPVQDIIAEVDNILNIAPKTNFIFFEDDVFGMDINWLREFTKKIKDKISFNINMRFEFINVNKNIGIERLKLLKEAGCTGFSLGIESASEIIRKEILRRTTSQDLIIKSMEYFQEFGFKVRTYQIIGLPYGKTDKRTKMNFDADLETLELCVKLKEKTGLPTIAWASTLAPYPGTKIARYCQLHGFYNGDFTQLIGSETYRVKSVLRHLKHWLGNKTITKNDWLDIEEQDIYRDKLNLLMNYFPILASVKNGHLRARELLINTKLTPRRFLYLLNEKVNIPGIEGVIEKYLIQNDNTPSKLNSLVRSHIYENILFKGSLT